MTMPVTGEPVDLRVIASYRCELAENPLWHGAEQRLYWCDINAGRLFRHDFAAAKTELLLDGDGDPEKKIGGFTIEADGAILLFMAGGRIERWQHGRRETVHVRQAEIAHTRFNDVIADPDGRVFCGTMSTETKLGKLYRLDRDQTLRAVVEDVGCANGLAFTRSLKRLYFTDSTARSITTFEYDRVTGNLSLPHILVRTSAQDGLPDGMTVDAEDHIWSAHWEGGLIIRYAPSGEEIQRIAIPVPRVTSLTFCGHGLRTLCVTTATGDRANPESPQAGHILTFEPGVCGVAEFPSRICTA